MGGKEIGLVVDSATDVIDIARDTIQHPNLLESKIVSYVKGISKIDARLIILLDIELLLENTTNLDELKEIKDALCAYENQTARKTHKFKKWV